MEPTTRFQQALPYLLLSVSAPLSALHTRPCPQHPDVCPACGVCLHIGTSRSRLVRPKSSKARVRQTACLACGHLQITPLERYYQPNPSAEPDIGDDIPSIVNSTQLPRPSPALPATRNASPRDTVAPSSKPQISPSGAAGSRPKKKTGLQAMLARNREQQKEQEQDRAKMHQGGLSAFLNGL